MKSIYKYPLEIADSQQIDMPKGAQLLSIQIQRGNPCLWALIEIDAERMKRTIQMRGTGHVADGVGTFIATFQMEGGALIFHTFDGGESHA